jgi:pyridinium-3,5-bisthiocarboxylic acid mononucleotide nickel chelatase
LRALIFDPFAGISGDMTVGALLDLGVPAEWLTEFVASLGLGEIGVVVARVQRRGIDCAHVRFELPHEHAHRHLRHVVEIIERANTSPATKERAKRAFTLLAQAEAEVHGTTLEKVHFHEVGALDAILDVLCSMAAIEELGFERFFTRPVALGCGWVDIEHGNFPVPAPATMKLLAGAPVTGHALQGECTTPTGAAILMALSGGLAPPAELIAGRSGFGAGTRDPQDRPNCLRLIEARVPGAADGTLYLIQADTDDLAPEYAAPAVQALLDAGALDAVLIPTQMKKGRPGLRVEALAPAAALDRVLAELFLSTSTIGARYWPVSRPALEREEGEIVHEGQRIRTKTVTLPGGRKRTKPEFEDVIAAARALKKRPIELRAEVERVLGVREG